MHPDYYKSDLNGRVWYQNKRKKRLLGHIGKYDEISDFFVRAGYHTLRELQEQAVLQNREVWEIVRNADMSENERSAEASFEKMTIMYQAMKQADQVIVLMDSSKVGVKRSYSICSMADVDLVISDGHLPQDVLAECERHRIPVL